MERRSILQNILNITAVFAAQPPTPPKDRDLSQPRVGLGSAPKIFPRLLATGLPKKLSSKLNALYHNRASRLQAVVVEQLAETWLNLCQKSILDDKLLRARFKLLADALIRQLKEGRNRLVEIAIDSGRTHAEEIRSRPRPKWDKKMVPIFEWIFDHNFGRYPSLNERHALAQASGLTYRQIVVWFQNRRARSKKRLAAEAAALERAENAAEGSELPPLPPSFIELLRQDPRIRPKRLIVEHLAALSPPADSDPDVQEFLGIPEEEILNDGRFLSARDEEEVIIREEYRCGIRLNELDSLDPPPYSFPRQMQEEPSLPAPSFPSPKWLRQPLAEEPSFLPVRTDEVILLHMQLGNLSVTPPPEDEMITTLCETYSILDLDGVGVDLDDENSADGLIPELDSDDSEGQSTSPEASPTPQEPEEVACLFGPTPSTRSPEQSLRILRRGVGKIPLLRTTGARAKLSSKTMAPPPRPRPKKLAVCKNIFNGRPKSIHKSRLPIIRELPLLAALTSTPELSPVLVPAQIRAPALPLAPAPALPWAPLPAPPQAPIGNQQLVVNDQAQATEDDNDDEDEYGEYIEDYNDSAILEDAEGVQFYREDDQLDDAIFASAEEAAKDDGLWDISPEESEASFSGTSFFDSDLEEASLSYMTMKNVNLSFVQVEDHFRTPPDLPECFNIPFDPVIAESALKQTLEQLNITPNWIQPIHDLSALCTDPYAYLWSNEPLVDPGQKIDLAAFSKAATDNLYAPNPTYELGEARPTYMEEYQATLPVYFEGMDYPGPEDGHTFQDARSIDLETLGWPPEDIDFSSLLSSITNVTTNDAASAAATVPAIFASQEYTTQESEFPEEYGDGSQYLVLDPDYDLKEWEQAIFQLPSFLPPGGIPTDGYPYIEPPPMSSYAPPPPEECRIFVSHGPTQTFTPLPPPPPRASSPSPLVVIPRPLTPLSLMPHLPPTPLEGSDGTEVSQNVITTGLSSLVSMLTSAPRYLFGGGTFESPPLRIEDIAPMSWEGPLPPPVLPLEDEFGLQTRSTWPTLPLLDSILDWF